MSHPPPHTCTHACTPTNARVRSILIVIMAVFNDGAMIALSKDRVVASKVPNSWNIPSEWATPRRGGVGQ